MVAIFSPTHLQLGTLSKHKSSNIGFCYFSTPPPTPQAFWLIETPCFHGGTSNDLSLPQPPSDLFLHFFQRESIPVEGLSGMSHTKETMMMMILPWDDSLSEPRLLDGRQRGWGNTDAFTSVYSLKFSRISLEKQSLLRYKILLWMGRPGALWLGVIMTDSQRIKSVLASPVSVK